MQKVDTAGVKQNVALARDRNPDFEEEILPFNELNTFLNEVLYECPHCGDGHVTLYGTMHGCYSQERRRGMSGPFRPEPKEAQNVDFFECMLCRTRFFIQHEHCPPVVLPRRKRNRLA